MDNGVLRFDHVRIPRDQMLMRVSQVTKDGKYVQSDVPRQLLFVTMVYGRPTIVSYASGALSRAVSIATRYSAVRRQFGSQNGGQELHVIMEANPVTSKVARYLMKTVSQLGSRKKPASTIAYMGKIEHLMQCQSDVEPGLLRSCNKTFQGKGLRNRWRCFAASMHSFSFTNIKEISSGLATYFLRTGYITSKQASFANEQLRALYSQLRPNAISLVDAFNYTDHFLGSILGRYDGNVYPKLYEAAWKDPLHESDVPDGFHEYIRPLLKQQLQTARL